MIKKLIQFQVTCLMLCLFFFCCAKSKSVPCVNAQNQTEYCDSICTRCSDGVGCLASSEDYCYIRSSCIEKGHLFTRHGTGISVCQMSCQPGIDQYSWTPAKTGVKCNDGIYCNGADFCEYDEHSNVSTCSRHLGDPCKDNNFCNNTCNEKEMTCFRKAEQCHLLTEDSNKCDEMSKCFHGQCTRQPIIPRPSCKVCMCDQPQLCNRTSGKCYSEPVTRKPSDDGNNDKHGEIFNDSNSFFYFALISGIVAALCMTCVLCIFIQWKKIKLEQQEKFRTMYHRVNDTIEDDDPEIARVINKGL